MDNTANNQKLDANAYRIALNAPAIFPSVPESHLYSRSSKASTSNVCFTVCCPCHILARNEVLINRCDGEMPVFENGKWKYETKGEGDNTRYTQTCCTSIATFCCCGVCWMTGKQDKIVRKKYAKDLYVRKIDDRDELTATRERGDTFHHMVVKEEVLNLEDGIAKTKIPTNNNTLLHDFLHYQSTLETNYLLLKHFQANDPNMTAAKGTSLSTLYNWFGNNPETPKSLTSADNYRATSLTIKINIFGATGCGKSSIFNRVVHGSFESPDGGKVFVKKRKKKKHQNKGNHNNKNEGGEEDFDVRQVGDEGVLLGCRHFQLAGVEESNTTSNKHNERSVFLELSDSPPGFFSKFDDRNINVDEGGGSYSLFDFDVHFLTFDLTNVTSWTSAR